MEDMKLLGCSSPARLRGDPLCAPIHKGPKSRGDAAACTASLLLEVAFAGLPIVAAAVTALPDADGESGVGDLSVDILRV